MGGRIATATMVTGALLYMDVVAAQEGGFALEPVEEGEKEEKEVVLKNAVELGALYVSDDSFKFGEYTGLEAEGPYAIGHIDLYARGGEDVSENSYFRVRGRDLGLESRDLELDYGRQGDYDLELRYNEIPHFRLDDARTPYNGIGSDKLTLPAGWGATNDIQTFPTLNSDLKDVAIEHERNRLGAGARVHFGGRWSFAVRVDHERREGLKTTAGLFGVNGGNPAAMILPEPIDYTTDEVDLSWTYKGEKGQARFGYLGSFFRNDNDSLTWQNVFSDEPAGSASEWPPAGANPYAGFNNFGFGRMSLTPDNEAHYLHLNAGYDVSERTRLSGRVRYGILKQNQDFLPYTINPNLSVPTALPRASLDGEIRQTLVDLALTARPAERWRLKGSVRYEDRDNRTPRDTYLIVHNDTSDQGTIDSADARINLPYSISETDIKLKAGYRLSAATRLSAGYQYELKDRTFAAVDETREQTASLRLSGRPADALRGWVEVAAGTRTADDYRGNAAFLASHTEQFLTVSGQTFENHPALRKFYLAEVDREALKGALSWATGPRSSLTLHASYSRDDYDASELGLMQRSTARVSVEPSVQISEAVSGYAYYTYERLKNDQRGHSFRPFPPTLDSLTDPGQRWTAEITDDVNTLGLGLAWKGPTPNLDLSLEYTLADATTETDMEAGAELQPVTDLPDLNSRLGRVSLRADYRQKKNLTWRVQYIYETFETDDFAVDGTAPDSLTAVLGLGESSPDYDVSVVGLSLRYKF